MMAPKMKKNLRGKSRGDKRSHLTWVAEREESERSRTSRTNMEI